MAPTGNFHTDTMAMLKMAIAAELDEATRDGGNPFITDAMQLVDEFITKHSPSNALVLAMLSSLIDMVLGNMIDTPPEVILAFHETHYRMAIENAPETPNIMKYRQDAIRAAMANIASNMSKHK